MLLWAQLSAERIANLSISALLELLAERSSTPKSSPTPPVLRGIGLRGGPFQKSSNEMTCRAICVRLNGIE
jgi:hypothetical protein